MADVFESVFGQPRVREFLRACVSSGKVSHAYLFCGPSGSNKTQAAFSFARAIPVSYTHLTLPTNSRV